MVNHMRRNRSQTGNRRSHHALDEVRLSKCSNCNEMHLSHTLCEKCGFYGGKKVIDMTAIVAKRTEKAKRKEEVAR
jgi:large subunit ribosomal protein L32